MTDTRAVFIMPPLAADGSYPTTYTDEQYDTVEIAAVAKKTDRNSEILVRLERIDNDLGKVLDVVAQLEVMITRVAPIIDKLAENPAKFLMSVIGGNKGAR